jgi:hypothetical protein
MSGLALAPLSAAAQSPAQNPFENIPVTGTITEQGGGTFSGTLNIERFQVQGNREIVAVGRLSGTLKPTNGPERQVRDHPVRWPVQSINGKQVAQMPPEPTGLASLALQASCAILDLVLGPLDLNLLGLRVQLNQVVLHVTGVQGQLLGDLLCALSGLLSGGPLAGLLQQIVDLLNQIIDAIG